jgi:hypothetical protein
MQIVCEPCAEEIAAEYQQRGARRIPESSLSRAMSDLESHEYDEPCTRCESVRVRAPLTPWTFEVPAAGEAWGNPVIDILRHAPANRALFIMVGSSAGQSQ